MAVLSEAVVTLVVAQEQQQPVAAGRLPVDSELPAAAAALETVAGSAAVGTGSATAAELAAVVAVAEHVAAAALVELAVAPPLAVSRAGPAASSSFSSRYSLQVAAAVV